MVTFVSLLRHPARPARRISIWIAMSLVLLVGLAHPALANPQVTASASVDNPNPAPGDSVIYSIRIRIEGAQMNLGNITAPTMPPGLASGPLQSVGKSESFEIINGAISQSTDYRFAFRAHKEGNYEIPAQELLFQGNRIPINSVQVTVSQAAPPADVPPEFEDLVVPPSAPGNPELSRALNGALFILPNISNKRIYEGQQITLSYHLIWDPTVIQRSGLRPDTIFVEGVELPNFAQFVKEVTHPLPRSLGQVRRERQIGNRTYLVATLYEVALTPTRTGEISIDPARLAIQIPTLQRGGRSGIIDPFDDPFFADDPVFGALSGRMGMNRVRLVANSPELQVQVLPVPTDGRPKDWNGAVGEFDVVARLDRTSATANSDIVRLDITIEGRGDAAGLPAPNLPSFPGLRLLEDPKSQARSRVENQQLIQSKTFSYLFRPEKEGDLVIPSLTMSIFQPELEKFVQVETQPLVLEVLPGTSPSTALTLAAPPPVNRTDSTADAEPVTRDFRFPPSGPPRTVTPLPSQGLITTLLVAPPLMALALIGAVRRAQAHQHLHHHAHHHQSWESLAHSAIHLVQQPTSDLQPIAKFLRHDLAIALGLTSTHPTLDDLESALVDRIGHDDPTIEKRLEALRILLQAADAQRYAGPMSSSLKPEQIEEFLRILFQIPSAPTQKSPLHD